MFVVWSLALFNKGQCNVIVHFINEETLFWNYRWVTIEKDNSTNYSSIRMFCEFRFPWLHILGLMIQTIFYTCLPRARISRVSWRINSLISSGFSFLFSFSAFILFSPFHDCRHKSVSTCFYLRQTRKYSAKYDVINLNSRKMRYRRKMKDSILVLNFQASRKENKRWWQERKR